MADDLEVMPLGLNLSELVDELDVDGDAVAEAANLGAPSNADLVSSVSSEEGSRAAEAFCQCAGDNGFAAFLDALAFCGLRADLPKMFASGVTIFAPNSNALSELSVDVRSNPDVVRALLLGHICAGKDSLVGLRHKNCAVALSGQTHSIYTTDGADTWVGTAQVGRSDIQFDGGVIHEVTAVMLQIVVTKECHAEQVWKKTLQPSPCIAIVGGPSGHADFEVHGCLVHINTGGIVPEAMRGHIRKVGPNAAEQVALTFSEITVMAKPPSLAKRRGKESDGINHYRLLFSLWNATSTTYVSWQHMPTAIVVRNSFHMLPIEEKEYRRQQYAKSRGHDKGSLESLGDEGPPIALGASSSSSSVFAQALPHAGGGAPGSSVGGNRASEADSLEAISPSQFIPPALANLSSTGSLGTPGGRLPKALEGFSSLSSDDMNLLLGGKPRGAAPPMRTESGDVINVLTGAPVVPPNTPAQGAQHAGFAADAAGAVPSVDLLSKPIRPSPLGQPPAQAMSGAAAGEEMSEASLAERSAVVPVLKALMPAEGPSGGGCEVWLHGENFAGELLVLFGSPQGATPARSFELVSPSLIKCVLPPCQPVSAFERHAVQVQVVSAASDKDYADAVEFVYVPEEEAPKASSGRTSSVSGDRNPERMSLDQEHKASPTSTRHSGSGSTPVPPAQKELITRLLAALERARAAADGATLEGGAAAASLFDGGEAGSAGLFDYIKPLRTMLRRERRSSATMLHGQMGEMAKAARRSSLADALMRRPSLSELQGNAATANILPAEEAETIDKQINEKRKRLSGLLVNRPNPEKLQHILEGKKESKSELVEE